MEETVHSKRVDADGEGVLELKTQPEDTSATEHVLYNPLVLDLIFDNLPKKLWKSARLVNKTWHSTLQPKWRSQMSYILRKCVTTQIEDEADAAKFLEQKHPENNPNDPLEFGRHPIRNISTRFNPYNILIPFQFQFWELFGHGLKRLTLRGVRIHGRALLRKLLFELTPSLEEFRHDNCVCDNIDIDELWLCAVIKYTQQKNLKHFYVDYVHVDNKRQFPISWMEFFSFFPNIQKLVLKIDQQSDKRKLFEAINAIRKANNNEVLNITELDAGQVCSVGLSRDDGWDLNNQLLFTSLPISNLKINLKGMSHYQITLVLQALKSTLCGLTLEMGRSVDDDDYLPNDILPHGLTKLCLLDRVFSSLEFLLYTPNLEELVVMEEIYCILPSYVELDGVTPLVNLKKLRYIMPSEFDLLSNEEMDILAKLMPNVKRCNCYVGAGGFRALCRGWPNLEHLELSCEFDSEDFLVEHLIQLKRLRSLKLDFRVTDKSVFEGFLKMPSLNKIKLTNYFEITNEGLRAVEGKLCDGWTWN